MTRLTQMKYRAYPFLIATISVVAATGGYFRGH
jgi:hypothetical protein